MQWSIPFRAYSAANWLALNCQRHMHEYGTTPEQLAMIASTRAATPVLNPKAVYRDPMTLDDYFASRMITTPFRLFDCDAPVDGSTAVIVSAAEHAANVDHPVARVEAVGTALRGRPSWDQFDDSTTMAARDAGAHLWKRTDLKPADVDVAELYDGFSFLAMTWLEALGLLRQGRERSVHRGRPPHRPRRRAAAQHPRRPAVGRSAPRLRVHPRGRASSCAARPASARSRRPVEVAAVANGGGPIAGALLLSRLT